MYTVMLLDDEPWELRGMRAMIPWAEHGFSVQYALSDSTEALDILLRTPVDVLLTDIRMPALSGVDLLVRLHEAGLETVVVFLSGYAEFSYAQTAVKMGAFDYLLKPLGQQEMVDFLVRLQKHLDARQEIRSLLLYEKLLYHTDDLAAFLPDQGHDTRIRMVMLKNTDAQSQPDFPGTALQLPCSRDARLYLLAYQGSMPDIPSHLWGISVPCGVSEEHTLPALRPTDLIEQAAYAFYAGFVTGEDALVVYHPGNPAAIDAMVGAFHDAFSGGNAAGLHRLTGAWPGELASMGATMEDVHLLWNACLFVCCPKDGLYKQLQVDAPAEIVRQFASLQAMTDTLYRLASSSLRTKPPHSASQGKKIYDAMIQYIAQRYTAPLTLPEAASAAGTNTTTANKLFRQYANTTFARYVTDFRIRKACELLMQDTHSTEEICYMTGYTDYFYFSKVFKKQMGVTPYQYRKGLSGVPARIREQS